MTRTPRWWRALPTWVQALWLTTWLPGVVAHEAIHWLVAQPAGDPQLDWDTIAVEMPRETSRPLVLAAAYIAPLVAGVAVSTGVVLVLLGQSGTAVPLAVLAYAVVNLALWTVASVTDLLGVLSWTAVWLQRRRDPNPVVEEIHHG